MADTTAADSKYMTTPPAIETMPPGIPYIVGNEAAERFSYYGMRAILTVFMFKYLYLMSDQVQPQMSEAEATANFHTFASWVYLFPIVGAIISDAVTGKYRIIVWVSVLYCFGHLALALMGSPPLTPQMWLWVGLFMIALGSGGIKPCVSAHVGDQFGAQNQHLMGKVYQWFYFSINFGSTISTLLTPWLLKWYGPHIAFGVPGVLMAIATLMFWVGRYKFIHMPPAGATFFKEVFSKKGLTTIAKLMVVYSCISVFWALFDQTSSSWVLQAEDMDRNLFGIEWTSSQMQAVNPILVMLLIPVFQFGIYPAINKVFRLTQLRKISIGLFVTVVAFAFSSVIQQWIDTGYEPSIGWQILAYVIITSAEVMVSITGLEFSYAQAPKAMKSIIMSVWLFSVSLGNYVTAAVNHAIQVPGIGSVVSKIGELDASDAEVTHSDLWLVRFEKRDEQSGSKTVRLAGFDQRFDTDDDSLLTYDEFGNLTSLTTPQDGALKQAKEQVDGAFFESAELDADQALPDDQRGNTFLAGTRDALGNPIRYHRVTRDRYRLVSSGADGEFDTPWDVVLNAQVSRANPPDESAEKLPYTWRERRIIELKGVDGQQEVDAERGDLPETEINSKISIGGVTTLAGADYYWFWTYVMLGGALLFVPIAYFYKDQTQIPGVDDDIPADRPLAEGTDAGT